MYKAWLSTDGVGAYSRISPLPWPSIRPDGKLVAVSLAAIVVDGPQKLLAAIEVTEKGSRLKGAHCTAG